MTGNRGCSLDIMTESSPIGMLSAICINSYCGRCRVDVVFRFLYCNMYGILCSYRISEVRSYFHVVC